MRILDKTKIHDREYSCTQILFIDDRKIYKLYNLETNDIKFVEENTNEIITDKSILDKINKLTRPKTDIISNAEIREK